MAAKTDPLELAKYGLLAVGFYMAYRVMKGAGLIPSASDAQAADLNLKIDFKDYTKPEFYKKAPPAGYEAPLFTAAATDKLITDIYKSTGVFNDCEECIVGAIKSINYKTQYSWLAANFYKKYKKDLTSFIKEYFNEKELYPAWTHLEALPVYRKKQ